jgi:XTP/dITP diphosphohydrolase
MQKTQQTIVLASGNQGKLQELKAILADLQVNLIPQADTQAYQVEETGTTFIENAIIKARHASSVSGLPAIADDSGLVVAKLNGEPGVNTARYAGIDSGSKNNMEKLLSELSEFPTLQHRQASFVCVLVYMRSAIDPLPVIAMGQWHGAIALEPIGEGGFGYDPVFWDFSHNMTAAQMSSDLKASLSHRGRAGQRLKVQLMNLC